MKGGICAIVTFLERYGKRIEPEPNSGCWLWMGAGDGHYGYGSIRSGRLGRATQAHRVAYEMTYGPVPEGHYVCHKCDNPPCVNPAHLFAGPPTANSRDCLSKGRHYTPFRGLRGSKHGMAKLTEEQVLEIRGLVTTTPRSVIARQYGVTQALVGMIVNRKVWTHV